MTNHQFLMRMYAHCNKGEGLTYKEFLETKAVDSQEIERFINRKGVGRIRRWTEKRAKNRYVRVIVQYNRNYNFAYAEQDLLKQILVYVVLWASLSALTAWLIDMSPIGVKEYFEYCIVTAPSMFFATEYIAVHFGESYFGLMSIHALLSMVILKRQKDFTQTDFRRHRECTLNTVYNLVFGKQGGS